MFNNLRRLGFNLFVFICALLSANVLCAATKKTTFNSIQAQSGIATSDVFSGADLTVTGTGTQDGVVVNDITINYNGNLTDGLQTVGTVEEKNNTLTMSGGSRPLAGDATAAKLTINNGSSMSKTDLSLFNFSLKNNTVNMNAKLGDSEGNIYGAVLQSNESGVGNATVQGNAISVGAAAGVSGEQPSLIGGMMQITTTTHNISSNAVVSSNTVTVAADSGNEINGDIIGGKFVFDVHEESGLSGTRSYTVDTTMDGNKVTLSSGKFYGDVYGAQAITSTGAEYKTMTVTGNVQNNEIEINGGKYKGNVFVGGSVSLEESGLGTGSSAAVNVNNNKITITDGQFEDVILVGGAAKNDVRYTQTPSGNITGNTIEISGASTKFSGNVYLFGGYTTGDDSVISGNTLSLKTGGIGAYGVDYFDTYKFDISGAAAGDTYLSVRNGNGHNNDFFESYDRHNGNINLDGATFSWAEGGRPTALGVGDTVTLLRSNNWGFDGTIADNGVEQKISDSGNDYFYKVLQIGNRVELLHNGLTVGGDWGSDISFSAGSDAGEDVYMHVDSGTITASSISVTSTANATATLTAKTLDVSSQSTALSLSGTTGDKVKFNTINVGDGQSLTKSGSGFYGFNTMNITGTGTVNSLDAMSGGASTVNIATAATFDTVNIGAGSTLTVSGATYGFNTLGVHGTGNTLTGNLAAANKNVNFYLDSATAAGDTALNVSGTADITGSNVQVGVTGSTSALAKNDQVVLLQAGTLTGDPAKTVGVGMQGLFLTYDFDLETAGNQLIATVTKAGLTPESKAFSEGRAAAMALVSQGYDFAAQTGISSAANAAWDQGGLALFTAFGGGKSRLETGSHVDMNTINAMVGLSREVSIFKADFVVGSFIEYGHGKYDTYNDFASGSVKGNGSTDYTGLGAMARWYGQDGSYVEGTLHTGMSETDFSGAVFFADKQAKYDFDSWYYGGHFGVGRVWNLFDDFDDEVEADAIQIDGSVKYFLNHNEAKDVSVSSGDELRFRETNSSRLRAGLKANFFASRAWRPYIGAAFDYEFNGKAHASTYNMRIDAPTLQGGTGVGEIGLSYVTKGFTVGIGAEGYVGVRQGWSGNAKLGFTF